MVHIISLTGAGFVQSPIKENPMAVEKLTDAEINTKLADTILSSK